MSRYLFLMLSFFCFFLFCFFCIVLPKFWASRGVVTRPAPDRSVRVVAHEINNNNNTKIILYVHDVVFNSLGRG